MLNRNLARSAISLTAVLASLGVSAQTMPNKWDQKCLDAAGKAYISCMASATTEPAKQNCQEVKAAADKKCKIAMYSPASMLVAIARTEH